MDSYKKIYQYSLEGDNPYINVDMLYTGKENRNDSHTSSSTDNTESDGNSNQNNNYQNIHSDNPQVTIGTGDYASTMDRAENVITSTSKTLLGTKHEETGKSDSHTGNERKEMGLRGKTKAEMLSQYRKIVLNINSELIELCSTLFLGVW